MFWQLPFGRQQAKLTSVGHDTSAHALPVVNVPETDWQLDWLVEKQSPVGAQHAPSVGVPQAPVHVAPVPTVPPAAAHADSESNAQPPRAQHGFVGFGQVTWRQVLPAL